MSGTTTYGAFSDYLERALLGHVFRGLNYPTPGSLYVSLFTTAPSDAGPGAEPAGSTGYARIPITFSNGPDLSDGSASVVNTAVLQFGAATLSWGIVQWVGVHDAPSGGNFLAWGGLVAPRPVEPGDAVRFGINQIVIGLQ